jgi:uncharacterized membrane protein YhaH (DUF805 family)
MDCKNLEAHASFQDTGGRTMNWAFMPLWRYAEFSGRSRRKEYWMFMLLNLVVIVAFGAFLFLTAAPETMELNPTGDVLGVVFLLWILATLVPSFALQARRFHDQGMSGWWVLLGFIPYVGGFIMMGFALVEGTAGPNQYGRDPRESNAGGVQPV